MKKWNLKELKFQHFQISLKMMKKVRKQLKVKFF